MKMDSHENETTPAAHDEKVHNNNETTGSDNEGEEEAETEASSKKPQEKEKNYGTFWLTMTSNLWFLASSVLYVWTAVMDLQWAKEAENIPQVVLEADDDWTWSLWEKRRGSWYTDDYVMEVGGRRDGQPHDVSKYTIVASLAAFGFVVVGILDQINYGGFLAAFFVIAGCFGLLSAFFVERNEHLSDVFNCVSVHMFLLEAVGILVNRSSFPGLWFWHKVGNATFLLATIFDVAGSYVVLFGTITVALEKVGVFSATLWLTASVIWVGATMYIKRHGGFDYNNNNNNNTPNNKEMLNNGSEPEDDVAKESTTETPQDEELGKEVTSNDGASMEGSD